jgi:hypothetical protein
MLLFWTSAFVSEGTPIHLDGLAMDEGIGNLSPGSMEVAPEGFPGDSHHGGCFLLFKAQEVNESKDLKFVRKEHNAFSTLC